MGAFPAQQAGLPAGLRLTLADQLLLLAFNSGDGRLRMGARSYLSAGLAGAVLTDLALCGSVTVDQQRSAARKNRVLATAAPPGEPFLDALMARVQAERPRALGWWIRKGFPGLHAQVLARLSAAGLVTTSRPLLRRHSYLTYPQAQAEALERVRHVVLADPALAAGLWSADPWAAALASLAYACHAMEVRWLPRDQRRTAKASLRVIRASDPIGQAVSDLVEQARRSGTTANPALMMTMTPG
jgi:Golgi phosphoprotein 3 GPP34